MLKMLQLVYSYIICTYWPSLKRGASKQVTVQCDYHNMATSDSHVHAEATSGSVADTGVRFEAGPSQVICSAHALGFLCFSLSFLPMCPLNETHNTLT